MAAASLPLHRQQLRQAVCGRSVLGGVRAGSGARRRCVAARSAAAASPSAASSSEQQQTLVPPTKLLALKEWAVLNSALAAGEQTILLRKGGIKEPRFTPAAREFLLSPTSFHSDGANLAAGVAERHAAAAALEPRSLAAVPLAVYCRVTGAWTTADTRVLDALDPRLHVCGPGFLDARLKWRADKPLTLLEVRAYALTPPLQLPATEDLFGCFSWVPVPATALGRVGSSSDSEGEVGAVALAKALAGARPALSDADFAARQALLREGLEKLSDVAPLEF